VSLSHHESPCLGTALKVLSPARWWERKSVCVWHSDTSLTSSCVGGWVCAPVGTLCVVELWWVPTGQWLLRQDCHYMEPGIWQTGACVWVCVFLCRIRHTTLCFNLIAYLQSEAVTRRSSNGLALYRLRMPLFVSPFFKIFNTCHHGIEHLLCNDASSPINLRPHLRVSCSLRSLANGIIDHSKMVSGLFRSIKQQPTPPTRTWKTPVPPPLHC